VLFVFCETAAQVIIRAFSTELFPTSHRGTAAGWIAFVQALGWSIGLWLAGALTGLWGTLFDATTGLAFLAIKRHLYERLTTPLLAGLSLPLDRIFRE